MARRVMVSTSPLNWSFLGLGASTWMGFDVETWAAAGTASSKSRPSAARRVSAEIINVDAQRLQEFYVLGGDGQPRFGFGLRRGGFPVQPYLEIGRAAWRGRV